MMRSLRIAPLTRQKVKQSLCSASFIVQAIKCLCLILFYYTFSISLTFYNQRIIQVFKFPLSFTIVHLVLKFILSALIRSILECKTGKKRTTLSWGLYIKKLAPTGVASALDIGFSNWSFEFITVSLYTMTKTSAIIFILAFSILFKLEKAKWSLVFVVLFISTGLFLFTFHSTQFNLEGFILVMTASFLSGLRWTLAQLVTQKSEIGLHNPLDMMYHVQPWMILGLLPLSAAFEGVHVATTNQIFRYSDIHVVMGNLGLILGGGLMAFFLEFSEYLLLYHTSSLTLSVAGIFKEVCTLYLAAVYNGDTMNLLNGLGLIICVLGIILHAVLKAVKRNEISTAKQSQPESMEMLLHDGEANNDSDEIEIFNAQSNR